MSFKPNPQTIAEKAIETHIEETPHGTSSAEQTIITAFNTHLNPLERNPHSLTPSDLNVYTKDEIDELVAIVQIFDGGDI